MINAYAIYHNIDQIVKPGDLRIVLCVLLSIKRWLTLPFEGSLFKSASWNQMVSKMLERKHIKGAAKAIEFTDIDLTSIFTTESKNSNKKLIISLSHPSIHIQRCNQLPYKLPRKTTLKKKIIT